MSGSPLVRFKTPLLFVVVFALPVILAKLALDQDWFNRGSTNRGELLSPPLSITTFAAQDDSKWRVFFVMPDACDQSCKNAIYSLNQVWLALGRQMDRVEPVVFVTANSDAGAQQALTENPNLRVLKIDVENVNEVFKGEGADGMFLSDTLGNVILRYPLTEQQQQAVMTSRDMLADLRKLLKLSKIG